MGIPMKKSLKIPNPLVHSWKITIVHSQNPEKQWSSISSPLWNHHFFGFYELYIYIYTYIYTLWLFDVAMKNGPFIDDLSESIMILPLENGDFPVRYGKNPAKSSQNYPHGPRGSKGNMDSKERWLGRRSGGSTDFSLFAGFRHRPMGIEKQRGQRLSAGPWKPK